MIFDDWRCLFNLPYSLTLPFPYSPTLNYIISIQPDLILFPNNSNIGKKIAIAP
ncbi:MAG: hypothetical protein SWX82_22510 [Cyanobacteriota bacterium]|nr:hypothetical protein [Cyanobacteriota bacterium]